MPWEVTDVKKERAGFVSEWESQDWSMAELCRDYGITRTTGYKWVNRYEEEGLDGLGNKSRAPHRHPNQTSEEVEKAILQLREKHRRWGARKIRAMLERQADEPVPGTSTIGAILQQYGLTAGPKKRWRVSQQPAVSGSGAANECGAFDSRDGFEPKDGKRCVSM